MLYWLCICLNFFLSLHGSVVCGKLCKVLLLFSGSDSTNQQFSLVKIKEGVEGFPVSGVIFLVGMVKLSDKLLPKSSRWATTVGLLLYFLLPTWGMFYPGRRMDMSVPSGTQSWEMLQQGCHQPLWCKQWAWQAGSVPDASLVSTFTSGHQYHQLLTTHIPQGPIRRTWCSSKAAENCCYCHKDTLHYLWKAVAIGYGANLSGNSIQAHKRWGDWEQSGRPDWGQILPDQPNCF